VPATERPRLRTRLALLNTTTAVVLAAVPVTVAGLGAWSGRSTRTVGTTTGASATSNAGPVVLAAALGLVVVALMAAPVGWALAGRALGPLREFTAAAAHATADRLPKPGELGRYEEFAELSATLAGLHARLDATYAAQRRFVADASHELRTPLTVQKTLIQVALAELDDPAGADAVAASSRAVFVELLRIGDHMERLVAALLALAQAQQGALAAEPVDLAEITADAVSSRGAPIAGPVVHADLNPAVAAAADPTLLAGLVGNLLDNAIRYNVDGGRVDVATRRQGTRAVLTVSNTGPVVPPAAVEEILQPFRRLAASRTGRENSGLGLAIVRAVAERHGADLRVVPNREGGLTVTVAFEA
jgi:signal transduction histidine kinase